MKPEWEFLTKSIYDPEVFWVTITAVAAVAALFLVVLAAIPPWGSREWTRRTDLVRRLKEDFLTRRVNAIIFFNQS